MFVGTQDADLVITDPPDSWTAARSSRIARLTMKHARYPGLWVHETYPDWTGHRSLRFNIYSEMNSPVQLTLRIHDGRHNNAYKDRFNYLFTVLPGANALKIPLDAVRRAPASREMDMQDISTIALFASNPKETYTIDIDGMWLE